MSEIFLGSNILLQMLSIIPTIKRYKSLQAKVGFFVFFREWQKGDHRPTLRSYVFVENAGKGWRAPFFSLDCLLCCYFINIIFNNTQTQNTHINTSFHGLIRTVPNVVLFYPFNVYICQHTRVYTETSFFHNNLEKKKEEHWIKHASHIHTIYRRKVWWGPS